METPEEKLGSSDTEDLTSGSEVLKDQGHTPVLGNKMMTWTHLLDLRCQASAAKSLQLCPTLCSPIDGSPPGSPVPGILQARTLEWVAIYFSKIPGSNLFLKGQGKCLVTEAELKYYHQ